MLLGDAWFVCIIPKNRQHCAPPLVETGFGKAGFNALGHGIVAAALILHLNPPQWRAANGMGNHDTQRNMGLSCKRCAHRRMAVQVNLTGHR